MIKIPLYGFGGSIRAYAKVDDDFPKKFLKKRWHKCSRYARHTFLKKGKWSFVLMHRVAVSAPKGKIIDHKNGDGFDNRKKNLRICSSSDNQFNRFSAKKNKSGFVGVHFSKRNKKWIAQIGIKGKRVYLGIFKTKREAIKKRQEVVAEISFLK